MSTTALKFAGSTAGWYTEPGSTTPVGLDAFGAVDVLAGEEVDAGVAFGFEPGFELLPHALMSPTAAVMAARRSRFLRVMSSACGTLHKRPRRSLARSSRFLVRHWVRSDLQARERRGERRKVIGMRRPFILGAGVVLVVVGVGGVAWGAVRNTDPAAERAAEAVYTAAHRSQAAVAEADARRASVALHAGAIVESHLEDEGSGLRWETKIADASGRWEVQVDAATGRVVSSHADD